MEEQQIATIGTFCLNEECGDYKKINRKSVVKCGKTDTGVQRYRCKMCKKSFTETKGTMFYRCRHTEEEIIECMAMKGMHPMRGHQPYQQMRKELIERQCLKHGEKYQNIVDEEHHQNFLNQERTGSIRKLIKKRKGRKLESVRIKIIYGDEGERQLSNPQALAEEVKRTKLEEGAGTIYSEPQGIFSSDLSSLNSSGVSTAMGSTYITKEIKLPERSVTKDLGEVIHRLGLNSPDNSNSETAPMEILPVNASESEISSSLPEGKGRKLSNAERPEEEIKKTRLDPRQEMDRRNKDLQDLLLNKLPEQFEKYLVTLNPEETKINEYVALDEEARKFVRGMQNVQTDQINECMVRQQDIIDKLEEFYRAFGEKIESTSVANIGSGEGGFENSDQDSDSYDPMIEDNNSVVSEGKDRNDPQQEMNKRTKDLQGLLNKLSEQIGKYFEASNQDPIKANEALDASGKAQEVLQRVQNVTPDEFESYLQEQQHTINDVRKAYEEIGGKVENTSSASIKPDKPIKPQDIFRSNNMSIDDLEIKTSDIDLGMFGGSFAPRSGEYDSGQTSSNVPGEIMNDTTKNSTDSRAETQEPIKNTLEFVLLGMPADKNKIYEQPVVQEYLSKISEDKAMNSTISKVLKESDIVRGVLTNIGIFGKILDQPSFCQNYIESKGITIENVQNSINTLQENFDNMLKSAKEAEYPASASKRPYATSHAFFKELFQGEENLKPEQEFSKATQEKIEKLAEAGPDYFVEKYIPDNELPENNKNFFDELFKNQITRNLDSLRKLGQDIDELMKANEQLDDDFMKLSQE